MASILTKNSPIFSGRKSVSAILTHLSRWPESVRNRGAHFPLLVNQALLGPFDAVEFEQVCAVIVFLRDIEEVAVLLVATCAGILLDLSMNLGVRSPEYRASSLLQALCSAG